MPKLINYAECVVMKLFRMSTSVTREADQYCRAPEHHVGARDLLSTNQFCRFRKKYLEHVTMRSVDVLSILCK